MTPDAEVAGTARGGRDTFKTASSERGASVGERRAATRRGSARELSHVWRRRESRGAREVRVRPGRNQPRFPTVSFAKEFAQATGRVTTAGLTDRQALHSVLAQRQNRYLVRSMCWMLTVEGLDNYALVPRDPADFDLLVEALRPAPSPMDIDAVIGARGLLARPELCGEVWCPSSCSTKCTVRSGRAGQGDPEAQGDRGQGVQRRRRGVAGESHAASRQRRRH